MLRMTAAPWDDGGGDGVSHLAIVAGHDTAQITKNDQYKVLNSELDSM